jgi:phosphoglycolate phosphatase
MNIVFDLDGTLIDSAPDIRAIANTLLTDIDKPGLTLQETRAFIGEGAAVLIQRMMAARSIEAEPDMHRKLLSTFIGRYETMPVESTFYPGVLRLLTQLQAQKHCLAICTNKPEGPTRAVLRQSGLIAMVDGFISGGMLNTCKPDPAMLHHVIGELSGAQTLYVGDSETDAETAIRAGVPFALFSGGYHKGIAEEIHHDWLFSHFDELGSIVNQIISQ